jgi:hypothetical protein
MKKKIGVDDRTYKLVKEYASKHALSIEEAMSKLICRGLGFRIVNGLFVFDLPDGMPRVTNERVKELESELEIKPEQG